MEHKYTKAAIGYATRLPVPAGEAKSMILRHTTKNLISLPLAVVLCMLAGCSGVSDDSPQNTAAVAALNAWWKQTMSDAPVPEKPGTVTPAKAITINGMPHLLPKHVQTQAEYEEQLKDVQWEEHMRNTVTGFRVSNNTVTVLTNATRTSTYDLNPSDRRDAQEVCHELGAFIWARDNRHWGLENIRVLGASGELLSSRTGLSGKVE